MNYIEHHGILGQKWGVRRFQNEDGSLTKAGEERYSNNTKVKKKDRKQKTKTRAVVDDINDDSRKDFVTEKTIKRGRDFAMGAAILGASAAALVASYYIGEKVADKVVADEVKGLIKESVSRGLI